MKYPEFNNIGLNDEWVETIATCISQFVGCKVKSDSHNKEFKFPVSFRGCELSLNLRIRTNGSRFQFNVWYNQNQRQGQNKDSLRQNLLTQGAEQWKFCADGIDLTFRKTTEHNKEEGNVLSFEPSKSFHSTRFLVAELYNKRETLGKLAAMIIEKLNECNACSKDSNGRKTVEPNKYVLLLENNRNIILHGAPGTGKTYLAKEIAKEMGCSGDRIGFVQFHPSYDYTDFIEGLRPTKPDEKGNIGFERKDGVFKAFCEKALKDEDTTHKYVFIIDEINRGEMSKIFGELFFSIDPGYRGMDGCIKTQYANMLTKANAFDEALQALPDNHECKKSQEDLGWFFVPENVYIIGTMNDIDRSVESMDFAMRRRFAFKEVEAAKRVSMLDDDKDLTSSVCENLKTRMSTLNGAIKDIAGLSSAYHIGAAYFLKYKLYVKEADPLTALWENHLKGLLKEYLRGIDDDGSKLEALKKAYDLTTDVQNTQAASAASDDSQSSEVKQ